VASAVVAAIVLAGCGASQVQRDWCNTHENDYLIAYRDLGGNNADDLFFQIAAYEYMNGTNEEIPQYTLTSDEKSLLDRACAVAYEGR
jgi:hypothetical protein